MKLPIRAIVIGALFSGIFSYIAAVNCHREGPILPATQISSISFIFLFVLVLAINPLLKFLKIRILDIKELMLIATMAIVPAGLHVFGFVSQFIPLAGQLHNPTHVAKYQKTIIPNVNENFYVTQTDENWEYFNKGMRISEKEAYPVLIPKEGELSSYPSDVINYFFGGNTNERSFLGEIPWEHWSTPIFHWCLLIGICLIFFYSLNELLFKQWYSNEKLVFPHAELISSLVQSENNESVPKIYKSSYFWIGFSISFLVMFYNGAATIGWLPGLQALDLQNDLRGIFENTIFEGLNYKFRLSVFFVVIGLAFLLPAEVSFSMWFFFLFFKFQQLIAVNLGYGENSNSFRGDFASTTNFMTSQGGGAIILFGLVCLWKVRHNLMSFIYKFTSPNGKSKYSSDDIKENALPSFLFMVSSLALIAIMVYSKISIAFSLVIYVMILVVTITLVRLVSEGGLIGFQIYFGPIHIMKNMGLFQYALFSIKSVAAAMPLLGSFFMDVKTFIAPTMMTAKNLSHRSGVSKGAFASSLIVCLVFSLLISILTTLAMLYDLGSNSMQNWFMNGLPHNYLFKNSNMILNNPEVMTAFNASEVIWTGVGAVSMGVILYLRTFLFWFPHPIGLLMVANPLVGAYWFSFFLAWLFKTFSVKYCKPKTNKLLKNVFIGLIIGELLVVVISSIVNMAGLGNMLIDLNRN